MQQTILNLLIQGRSNYNKIMQPFNKNRLLIPSGKTISQGQVTPDVHCRFYCSMPGKKKPPRYTHAMQCITWSLAGRSADRQRIPAIHVLIPQGFDLARVLPLGQAVWQVSVHYRPEWHFRSVGFCRIRDRGRRRSLDLRAQSSLQRAARTNYILCGSRLLQATLQQLTTNRISEPPAIAISTGPQKPCFISC